MGYKGDRGERVYRADREDTGYSGIEGRKGRQERHGIQGRHQTKFICTIRFIFADLAYFVMSC